MGERGQKAWGNIGHRGPQPSGDGGAVGTGLGALGDGGHV